MNGGTGFQKAVERIHWLAGPEGQGRGRKEKMRFLGWEVGVDVSVIEVMNTKKGHILEERCV